MPSRRIFWAESPSLRLPSGPAPGYRDSGYNKAGGALWLVGYYGYSWSTSILSGSSSARFLYFGYDGVSPQGNSYRAYGFPLRCLQVPLGTPTGPAGEKALPSHAEQHRPRASATEEITGVTVHCMSSATPGTVGRRPKRAPMPASWTSVPPGSIRKVQQSVRPVFRCVASRKRGVGARRILPSSRAGPNPLGENQSLSSPPLEPRGLLLSAMRQKVSKERSQGVFAPLAIPQRFLACPLRKFGPSPIPP